jgi:UDP-2,3-diacylglucosamine pyrophosphatase LpxH
MLHPTIGVKLGTFFSGSSRKYLRPRFPEWIKKEYREHANSYLKKGDDIVMFGHTHCGEIVNFPSGIYCNTGSWLVHYNYASMTSGELKLWSYTPGSSPQEILPIVWK